MSHEPAAAAGSPSLVPSLEPLPVQVTSLFTATLTEVGVFVAVFLAVTREGVPSALTLVEMAVFLAGLSHAAYALGRLYAPGPKSQREVLRRYRWAWGTFIIANVSVPIYFVVWWVWMLWRFGQ